MQEEATVVPEKEEEELQELHFTRSISPSPLPPARLSSNFFPWQSLSGSSGWPAKNLSWVHRGRTGVWTETEVTNMQYIAYFGLLTYFGVVSKLNFTAFLLDIENDPPHPTFETSLLLFATIGQLMPNQITAHKKRRRIEYNMRYIMRYAMCEA